MSLPRRWDTRAESVERDLARLVLTVVELLRELMERQALRRVDSGTLSAEQIENLGLGLMRLEQAMGTMLETFGLRAEDLGLLASAKDIDDV
jgi:gas vesicle protein GvpK